MPKIQWMKTPTMMVFVYKDKILNVRKDSQQYKAVSKLMRCKDREEQLIDYLYPELRIKKYTKDDYKIKDRKIVKADTEEPLPNGLQKKLLEMSAGYPYTAYKNFCKNLSMNPDKNSREQLYSFLEKYHFPITIDGYFLAYKYVTELEKERNGHSAGTLVDSHSSTFNNNPGKIVAMDRDKCVSDPNRDCEAGLHVAAFEYASSCGGGQVIIEVLVNPKDVVSVPTAYNCQKMRVCRYKVLKRNKKEVRDSYLSSKFIAGKKLKEKNSLETELEQMSARQIVAFVKAETGHQITNCLKSKKPILKKALQILEFKENSSSKDIIDLTGMTSAQVVEEVRKQTGYKITFSLKSKKAILRKAEALFMEHGLGVKF